ncbi:ganglioside GM2 activator-like [Asterias rubens]|uniref:ganglioside GM2 activator-like n=1 Tax=Asterias rubens TaxID=7604 RepID=UPI001455177C|nr:ganglioside GM2 activator-like [Asterias rubens]
MLSVYSSYLDDSNSPLRIEEFSFSPDPISADDYVYMSFKAEVTRNVTLPLTLSVSVKKITFFGWEMPISCLATGGLPFGSCTYDVCSAMDHLESSYGCPSEFTAAGLPCRCPFTPGYYNTNTGPVRFYLNTEGLPYGRFMSSFLAVSKTN